MKDSKLEVDVKTISDEHEEITRSLEAPKSLPAPTLPDASAAPTQPPPPLYPPPAYPEPRIAERAEGITSAPIIMIEEPAPETPRFAPTESMVRLATPAHAMPPVRDVTKLARATTQKGAPRPALVPPAIERSDERRTSLEAIIMTPGPMIPATLPPVTAKSRSKWLVLGPCLAMAVGALVGFGFAQRAALPSSRDTSTRTAAFAAARSIEFVRESAAVDVVPPTMGRIVTRSAELGRRVYVDGRVVGTSGESFTVTCGRHDVRIGTNGRPRIVDVACGADVDVTR